MPSHAFPCQTLSLPHPGFQAPPPLDIFEGRYITSIGNPEGNFFHFFLDTTIPPLLATFPMATMKQPSDFQKLEELLANRPDAAQPLSDITSTEELGSVLASRW